MTANLACRACSCKWFSGIWIPFPRLVMVHSMTSLPRERTERFFSLEYPRPLVTGTIINYLQRIFSQHKKTLTFAFLASQSENAEHARERGRD